MNLRELITKVGFEVDESPLERVEGHLEQIKKGLELVGAVEIAHKLYELGERFAEIGEQIHISSQNAGVSAVEFQKLTQAAEKSGISSEQMSHSLAFLSRNLYQAQIGSGRAAEAFRQAGLDPRQFSNSSQALMALADTMKNSSDSGKKMAISMALMGRGGAALPAFLSQGSAAIKGLGDEAERTGKVLSGGQVEALSELAHSFKDLKNIFIAIGATLAVYVAPIIQGLVDKFGEFWAEIKDLTSGIAEKFFIQLAYDVGFATGIMKGLVDQFLRFADAHPLLIKIGAGILAVVAALVPLAIGVEGASLVLDFMFGGLTKIWSLFTGFASVVTWVAGVLSEFVFWLSTVTESVWLLNAAVAIAEAPFWLIVAAIGAVIFVIHDLYKLLTGDWADSWTAKLVNIVGSFQWVQDAIAAVKKTWDDLSNSKAVSMIASLFHSESGASSASSVVDKVASVGSPSSALNAISSPAQGSGTFNFDSQVNITVPPGTDPAQTQQTVKETIKDHLDRMLRETQRGVYNPVAH